MKIEKLRNKSSKKYFLCGLIMVVALTVTVTFIGSKANYRMTASIPLTEGKVVASPYDINVIAIYLDGVEQPKDTTIPLSGYTINETDSFCCKGSNCKKEDKDTNVTLRTFAGLHMFRGVSKGEKCFLYFNKTNTSNAVTMNNLLENYYINKKERTNENKDFNVTYEEPTIKTVFTAPDDDGTTYYFAGNPLDNWINFGGYYWRIIRINGDGSIRIIYQGTEPNEKGEGTQIGMGVFSEKTDDNAYVGFMYGTPNSSTYEATHENKNDSNVKKILDNWFINSNIKQGTSYFEKIDLNAGFCSDRQPSSNLLTIDDLGGAGTISTYYGANVRLRTGNTSPSISSPAIKPTFKCINDNDLYTHTSSNKGNKNLVNPVGLITADEVAYAGMVYDEANSSSTNYLDTDKFYWTITPYHYNEGNARVICVWSTGYLIGNSVVTYRGIRPVINLRSDVKFTGNGTISNPYSVVE
ncbi:MAG: hypothetical protein NC483_06155 [Ruminococcus sp.]|nr:hypothetical protein [Ruminococcus sp.]